jgi:crossover junction endodeoxyribonuclease RusA
MSTLFVPAQPIVFTVIGTPRPQGSSRAFIPKGWSRPVITTDNQKLKPWRQEIASTAQSLNVPMFDRSVPVEITMNFYFSRPASAKKRRGMTVKPDIDKLVRGIFDSLTGILFEDDSQIVEHHARKHYGGPERVEIRVQEAV